MGRDSLLKLGFTLQHSVIIHANSKIDPHLSGFNELTTVTRSFRLDERLIENLAALAKKYGQTENQLVASWLSWRIGFDPLIPTFDGLVLTTETFALILETCDMDALEKLASELGKRHFTMSRTLFEAIGKQLTFVKFLSEILSKRANWFTIEGHGVDEATSEIILKHKLGIRWSTFLKSYLSGAYESVSHTRLTVNITSTFVTLKLNQQPEQSARRF